MIPVTLAVFFLTACSSNSGVKIDNSWLNGDYRGGPLKSILIVGLGQNPQNVKLWEDTFVATLEEAGYSCMPAYKIFTEQAPEDSQPEDLEAAKQKIIELGFDGVVLGKIRDVESGPQLEGGETHVVQTATYYSWTSYYAPQRFTVQDQTRVVNVDRIRVETNIYAVKGETLVYTAMIDSKNMNDPNKAIKGLVNVVIKDLKGRKVL
ncbi:MAG: hypothetical protein DRP71_02190 [Verrucomicrobia bacterium]|nr:MAG: hypothetical protein DRP71_02190 [Verrucomicrobiota bacterium]